MAWVVKDSINVNHSLDKWVTYSTKLYLDVAYSNCSIFNCDSNPYSHDSFNIKTNTLSGLGISDTTPIRAKFVGTFEANGSIRANYNKTTTSTTKASGQSRYIDIFSEAAFTNFGVSGYIKGTLYLEADEYVPVPPSTPSSITVPTTIKGGTGFTVSWGSGSGASSYYLERSVNGGSFVSIYNGSSRSKTESPLSTWNTVVYRVRSYNSDGYSSYRTSSTVTVKQFPEFKIRIDGTLKTSSDGWCRVDGVLRKIDGIWTRVNGVLKKI